jgi:transposase
VGGAARRSLVVQAWLARHPRVRLHFTPTYGSWVNLVEVFFAIIERQALRRGDLASVAELLAAIRRFCDSWNQRCRPFTWTRTPTRSWPSASVNYLSNGPLVFCA